MTRQPYGRTVHPDDPCPTCGATTRRQAIVMDEQATELPIVIVCERCRHRFTDVPASVRA
jgi:hypothetical protein